MQAAVKSEGSDFPVRESRQKVHGKVGRKVGGKVGGKAGEKVDGRLAHTDSDAAAPVFRHMKLTLDVNLLTLLEAGCQLMR